MTEGKGSEVSPLFRSLSLSSAARNEEEDKAKTIRRKSEKTTKTPHMDFSEKNRVKEGQSKTSLKLKDTYSWFYSCFFQLKSKNLMWKSWLPSFSLSSSGTFWDSIVNIRFRPFISSDNMEEHLKCWYCSSCFGFWETYWGVYLIGKERNFKSIS